MFNDVNEKKISVGQQDGRTEEAKKAVRPLLSSRGCFSSFISQLNIMLVSVLLLLLQQMSHTGILWYVVLFLPLHHLNPEKNCTPNLGSKDAEASNEHIRAAEPCQLWVSQR